tara:strand:- start:746 stop:1057 length:312 start_codon:yes stop_codon:yes gene_type:complete
MKWPFKDPDEILDYSVDWSRFLDTHSIEAVAWSIKNADGTKTAVSAGETVDGLTLYQQTNTATVATARFGAGTTNKTYKITCAVTFNTSLVSERVIQLPIKER